MAAGRICVGKYWGAFLSAGGMACLTAIPGFVSSDHLVWLRWRLAMAASLVLGLIGLAVQLGLQRREEKKRDKEEREWREKQGERDIRLISETIAEVKRSEQPREQKEKEAESQALEVSDSAAARSSPIAEEVYRVIISPKTPFAEQTRQVWQHVTGKKEFKIDVDFLVEAYIANASAETLYIRDFYGTIEIDGQPMRLTRQSDFFAWEINGRSYDWCLNLDESETPFKRQLAKLSSLSEFLQKPLEPKKPIEGWIRLLAPEVDPEKLLGNKTLKLFAVDTLGAEYPISHVSNQKRSGKLSIMQRPQ
jgi:hypothetical protein